MNGPDGDTSPCPNPETHGNPFRYCACGWMEQQPPRNPDLAAMAAYEAYCLSTAERSAELPPRWDQLPPEGRADWRAVADAVRLIGEMRP